MVQAHKQDTASFDTHGLMVSLCVILVPHVLHTPTPVLADAFLP